MNTGGPAFARPLSLGRDGARWCIEQDGMTLLDWFAGKALAGLLACSKTQGTPAEFAQDAYAHAAAMLAERERRMKEPAK